MHTRPKLPIAPLLLTLLLSACGTGHGPDDPVVGDEGGGADDDAAPDDDSAPPDDDSAPPDDDASPPDDDTAPPDDDTTGPDPCGEPDLSVPTPYPISGYWMYHRAGDCAWRQALEDVHRLGADTVIQFGPYPVARTAEEVAADADFAACTEGGVPCVQAAEARLQAAHPGNSLGRIFTLTTSDHYGDAPLACPGFDVRIEAGDATFWVLPLPAADPSDTSCDFGRGSEYDLVVIRGRPDDLLEELLTQADAMGMQVYVGMPSATPDPDAPWEVWAEARDLGLAVLDRILGAYAAHHALHPSFVGVYQSFELPVSDPTVESVLSWYTLANERVRARLPGRTILVSPYWDVRLTAETGVDVDSIRRGIQRIAETGMDVIAPQDGRGTGKVGLFWPYEEDEPVDARLGPAVGSVTYGEAYRATTTELYAAAREGLDALAVEEGLAVDLWANVEAFEPGAGDTCGYFSDIQRTAKERLDEALTFHGASASKLISFMWDGLYTCAGGEPTTLAEDVASDHARPIVSAGFLFESGGAPGLILRGYHIADAVFDLTWYDGAWQIRSATVSASEGWIDPDFGATSEAHPDRLQEVWIPFDDSDLAPAFWIHVRATGPGGTAHHRFSVAY